MPTSFSGAKACAGAARFQQTNIKVNLIILFSDYKKCFSPFRLRLNRVRQHFRAGLAVADEMAGSAVVASPFGGVLHEYTLLAEFKLAQKHAAKGLYLAVNPSGM